MAEEATMVVEAAAPVAEAPAAPAAPVVEDIGASTHPSEDCSVQMNPRAGALNLATTRARALYRAPPLMRHTLHTEHVPR